MTKITFTPSCLVPSIFILLAALTARDPGVLGLDFGYHDAQSLHAFLVNISKTYPSITQLYSVGKSDQGVDLWVIKIGENVHDHISLRPNVKYVGNMHGNEAVGREMLLHLVEEMVSQYRIDQNVTSLLRSAIVHIMPTMNPDGFAMANSTDCEGVTGRRNANNFDLNRNFPDFFQENSVPLQPETIAVMNWIINTSFVLSANLHGGALVANYPFDNYKDATTDAKASPTQDNDVFVHLAKVYSSAHTKMKTALPCSNDDPVFHDGITNGADWYPLTGGMQDYNYVYANCYELTLEISCCKYPAASELPTFWDDNKKALIAYLLQVNMGVKGLVKNKTGAVLHGALVTVEGRPQIPFSTSSHGEFWKLLLPGSYKLLVTKEGYRSKEVPFEVTSDQVNILDIVMEARGSSLISSTVLLICQGVIVLLFRV